MKPGSVSKRRIVTRAGRRFSVCGLPVQRAKAAGPVRYGLGWATGATLLVAILYSAYAIERPPSAAPTLQRAGIASLAHYTIDDFANISH
jgi:hypothetical protein